MKKFLTLAGILLASSLASFGATVTYSTSTSQLCVGASGCGVATQTIGNVTITFSPNGSSTVTANPTTFGSFGEITISCVGGGTACGDQSLSGLNLFINISQTAPTGGTASLVGGAITGTISGTASSAVITWATPNTVTIGSIAYSVQNNPLALVSPSSNAGVTSVQANIADRTVPEPSSMAMLGSGLLGLGFLVRRRK